MPFQSALVLINNKLAHLQTLIAYMQIIHTELILILNEILSFAKSYITNI